MDVEVDMEHEILVNNRAAGMDTLLYENFSLDWTTLSYGAAAQEPRQLPVSSAAAADRPEDTRAKDAGLSLGEALLEEGMPESGQSRSLPGVSANEPQGGANADAAAREAPYAAGGLGEKKAPAREPGISILVYVNQEPVRLTGKMSYIFVDVFDFYAFDLKAANGRAVVTLLNGRQAQFSETLQTGDQIELGWREL